MIECRFSKTLSDADVPAVSANLYGRASDSVARKNVETRSKYVMVALFSALVVAFESVSIEGALNIADIDLFLVSSMPSVIGGLILMGIYPKSTVAFTRNLGRRGWLTMLALCVFSAVGVILWFDAVSRIGASKEALLGGGSPEVLFVVILPAVFLSERLTRLEGIGSILVVVGVFVVLANIESVGLTIGAGEVEAIVSSLRRLGRYHRRGHRHDRAAGAVCLDHTDTAGVVSRGRSSSLQCAFAKDRRIVDFSALCTQWHHDGGRSAARAFSLS